MTFYFIVESITFSCQNTRPGCSIFVDLIGEDDINIGICCFHTKNTTLRCKNKDKLARNQDNRSEWSNTVCLTKDCCFGALALAKNRIHSVGRLESGHHHLIRMYTVLAVVSLENCTLGVKQQLQRSVYYYCTHILLSVVFNILAFGFHLAYVIYIFKQHVDTEHTHPENLWKKVNRL